MNAIGIIFSNIHDDHIPELTKQRTLGAIPFGGRYRLIDFVLSNMTNSGISSVGVIARNNYHSLLDHLGSGKEWDLSRKFGGLVVFPPYSTRGGSGLYRGRLEALQNAHAQIISSDAAFVILADCDVICNIDYRRVLSFHIAHQADITAIYRKSYVSSEDAPALISYDTDDAGRIYGIRSGAHTTGNLCVSMSMWVLKRTLLLKLMEEALSVGQLSLERDILAKRADTLRIYGYCFDGYVRQITSAASYFSASMDLLDCEARCALFRRDAPIYTKVYDEAPVRYGAFASVRNAMIANGSVICGSVENSIVARGVYVGEGAIVRNAVIMRKATIGEGTYLSNAIVDHGATIRPFRELVGHETLPLIVPELVTV